MCPDLFSEETPCGSILVSDLLPSATSQPLHFGWSLTGGSTVIKLLCTKNKRPKDWSVRNTTSGEFSRWLTTVYMKSIIASDYDYLSGREANYFNRDQRIPKFCTMERLSQISVDRRMYYVSRTDWILECDQWYVSSDFLISFTGIFFPSTLNLPQAFYGSTAFNYPASSSPTPTTKFSNVTLKICKKFISLRQSTPICELSVPLSRSGSKELKKETNSFRGLPFAT